MTTKAEIIASLKTNYPTLRSGDDEQGYTELSPADYQTTIEGWAINQLARTAADAQADTDKAILLAKFGITADEAKLLLS